MTAKPTWNAEFDAPEGLTEDLSSWPPEVNELVDTQLQELSLQNGVAVNIAAVAIANGRLKVVIEAVE